MRTLLNTSNQTSRSFLDEESSFHGKYSREMYRTLQYAYQPYYVRVVCLVLIGWCGRFLLLGNTNLIGWWVDSLCQAPSTCQGVPAFLSGFKNRDYLITLGFMTVFGFLATAIFRIGFSRVSAQAISQLYDETTMRTSRFPIRFFDQNPVGRIVTRFSSDYGNVFRLFGGPLAEFFAIISDLISMLVLITIASPLYLPVVAVVGALNYAVYRANRDRLRAARRKVSANRSPSIAHFAETAQGAGAIRIFSCQRTFAERFHRLNSEYLSSRLSASANVYTFSMQMNTLTAVLLLTTGLTGLYLTERGLVSIGSLGVAFTFIVLSGTSIQMFFDWLAQLEEALTGVERLNDYLLRDIEPGAKLPAARVFPTTHPVREVNEEDDLRRNGKLTVPAAAIDVRNLWFRYGEQLPWILKGLNLRIEAGEKIGIIGRTGSGKTSFVQALFHLYPFQKGDVRVDGVSPSTDFVLNTEKVDLGVFRRSLALISQEPTLFRATIRENLDFAGEHTDERLQEALDRVGLTEWLHRQPFGLQSGVEERGRNLSAGERQLICMARCLLQDAPVVVMDEATSSVDPRSEEILVRATREFFRGRTQIIIAHRLSTLEHCDRILWLHRGEVRAFDKPNVVLTVFRQTALVDLTSDAANADQGPV